MDSSCSSISSGSSNHSNNGEVHCSPTIISVNDSTEVLRKTVSAERASLDERPRIATIDRPVENCTNTKTRAKADFSIDAILSSRTSTPVVVVSPPEMFCSDSKTHTIISRNKDPEFSWVYCTRYRPPKLPRAKRDMNLRTRYRNPRIPFSISEVSALEQKFVNSPYLGSNDVNELAAALNMSPKRVKIWFQNRRARERREREIR